MIPFQQRFGMVTRYFSLKRLKRSLRVSVGHHLYQNKVGDVRLPSVRFVGGCRVHSTLSALLKPEPTTWSEAEWIAKEYE